MSEINTPTWPDFEITIIHTGNGPEYVRATIEGRLCNVAYSDAAYLVGDRKPRYPMPAIPTDHALHIRYPRVLSEEDRSNADDYFWRLYHRLYGKK